MRLGALPGGLARTLFLSPPSDSTLTSPLSLYDHSQAAPPKPEVPKPAEPAAAPATTPPADAAATATAAEPQPSAAAAAASTPAAPAPAAAAAAATSEPAVEAAGGTGAGNDNQTPGFLTGSAAAAAVENLCEMGFEKDEVGAAVVVTPVHQCLVYGRRGLGVEARGECKRSFSATSP